MKSETAESLLKSVKPLLEKLERLSSVLGTNIEPVYSKYFDQGYINCKTYLDKRQLNLDRVNGRIEGNILHEAGKILSEAGFSPALHCGSQDYYEWNIYNAEMFKG